MNIAILGYGVEGKETLKFVKNKYPKAKISILDREKDKDYLKNLDSFDIVFRSPGVPFNTKEIQKAVKKGVKVTSSTEVFLEGARGTVIAVTGTKGKTTTAILIYEILKRAGKNVYLAGNIGKSPIDLLPKLNKNSITVLELSSFQLHGISVSPQITVVLDIFPDHLDHHRNFKEYMEAKTNIVKFQRKNDVVFYVPASVTSAEIARRSLGQKVAVPAHRFPINLKIPGVHNIQNAAMAAAVASHLGVSPVVSLEIISGFNGVPHRLKFVKTVGGVSFYNDSASTNPETTVAALRSFPGKSKILIAGGRDKNLDFGILKGAVENEDVKSIVLFGECRAKIRRAIGGAAHVVSSNNLENVVKSAFKKADAGDVVIFSPGATSFDMFENYIDRGKKFERIVKKLK